MIRILAGQEIIVMCLNKGCYYWDDTCLFCCRKYLLTTPIINCPDGLFEPVPIYPIKP